MEKTVRLSRATTAIIEDDGEVQLHTACGGPKHDDTLVLILGKIRRKALHDLAVSDPTGFALVGNLLCERLGLAATVELQLLELLSIDRESAQGMLDDYEEALRGVAEAVSRAWLATQRLTSQ